MLVNNREWGEIYLCRRFLPLTVCVYLHKFSRNHFRKSHSKKPDKAARKQNLTWNSPSRSFKVMHSVITEKPTMDCVSLCNNAGNISKYTERIASEITENCCFWQPHCHSTSPLQGTPTNIRINLILPESRVIGLHRCRWQYGSTFIQMFVPFKVIRGRWFWHKSIARMRLSIGHQ